MKVPKFCAQKIIAVKTVRVLKARFGRLRNYPACLFFLEHAALLPLYHNTG